MTKKVVLILISAVAIVFAILGFRLWNLERQAISATTPPSQNDPLYQKFLALSTKGNSSCSGTFRDSIANMPDGQRLQGSCCSAMSWDRYKSQVEGLKKYSSYPEIPSDPYDIPAGLAKTAMAHYNDQLTAEQQKDYDYAMQNSNEKGPCCCKCWRWNVYGGLAKILIEKYKFTGQQITEIWNLSDGCGGNG